MNGKRNLKKKRNKKYNPNKRTFLEIRDGQVMKGQKAHFLELFIDKNSDEFVKERIINTVMTTLETFRDELKQGRGSRELFFNACELFHLDAHIIDNFFKSNWHGQNEEDTKIIMEEMERRNKRLRNFYENHMEAIITRYEKHGKWLGRGDEFKDLEVVLTDYEDTLNFITQEIYTKSAMEAERVIQDMHHRAKKQHLKQAA